MAESATQSALEADVLVVGGGMAGMTTAAAAARAGASVIVLEKAREVGGSAGLSEGYVWTAPTLEILRNEDPEGDERLGRHVVEELEDGLSWVASLGVHVGDPLKAVLGFGEGRQIDVWGFMRAASAAVEANGGHVVGDAHVRRLVVEARAVVGAIVEQEGEDVEIRAASTVLATGGFQADPDLVRKHIRPDWEHIVVRSNPMSTGDGIRLGVSVGAATTEDMRGFYGHLFPRPVNRRPTHSDYTALAQSHREHGVRAVLFCDDRIRTEIVMKPFVAGMQQGLDKFEFAGEAGANYARADSPDGLRGALASWGYDADRALATLREFNDLVKRAPEKLTPGRRTFRRTVDRPPVIAIEVQPAITFTYGGLRTDELGHVVDASDAPIPGLFAAGADQGGVYSRGYAGGLARGLVFGRRVAHAISAERDSA
jgi:succinate dehydrogenase/fumarate reductase flavoprotein subunit